MSAVKFSSKMDAVVLDQLRAHAERQGRTLSAVLTEAGEEYLQRSALRPVYRRAAADVIDAHAELLARLAK